MASDRAKPGRARAALMAGAVVAAALGVPPAHAGGGTLRTSFRSAGGCVEYATGVLVDAALAQAQVPDGFTVLDLGGKALVAMFAETCETSVDGGAPTRSILSGVFVFTDSERSRAGCGSYDFFWGDSRRSDWHRAMIDLGWREEFIPRSVFTRSTAQFAMAVPSRIASWSAEAMAVSAGVGQAVPFESVHCNVGPRGLVRGTFQHSVLEAGAGAGPVAIGRGPLWRALGASSRVVMPGLAFRFTFTGVTELVAP